MALGLLNQISFLLNAFGSTKVARLLLLGHVSLGEGYTCLSHYLLVCMESCVLHARHDFYRLSILLGRIKAFVYNIRFASILIIIEGADDDNSS